MTINSSDPPAPKFLTRADGLRLAYRLVQGSGPTLVFLPGYKSDMLGGKADAVARWAQENGRACLRLDYSGTGESEGEFEAGTLAIWRDDVLLLIGELVRGPVVLIGSSMGGWLMLHVALTLGAQVAGLIGIAAAPDFTQWGFTLEERDALTRNGRLERPSDYGPEPMVTTLGFWQSGQSMQLLGTQIPIDVPVRLLQGQRDDAVPWTVALTLAEQLRSADVQVNLIKDGDHRLSRDGDIELLLQTIKAMPEYQ